MALDPEELNKRRAQREQQRKQRRRAKRLMVLRLILALTISVALLAAAGYFAVVHFLENNTVVLPGQNYSSVDSTTPATEA